MGRHSRHELLNAAARAGGDSRNGMPDFGHGANARIADPEQTDTP